MTAPATSLERYTADRDRAAHPGLHAAVSRAQSNLGRIGLVVRALGCNVPTAQAWLTQRGYVLRDERCAGCSRVLGPRSCVVRTRDGQIWCGVGCVPAR